MNSKKEILSMTDHSKNVDFQNRSKEVRWPSDHKPEDSNLFAHNEIYIEAPIATVWQNLVDVKKWSTWYPNASNVKITTGLGDRIEAGSVFEWDTFGMRFKSEVFEFEPYERLAWNGLREGWDTYHAWLLRSVGDGTLVITEEAGKGSGAISLRQSDPQGMHIGHDLWLGTLKRLSEKERPS